MANGGLIADYLVKAPGPPGAYSFPGGGVGVPSLGNNATETLIYVNTTNNHAYMWDGAAFQDVTGSGGGGGANPMTAEGDLIAGGVAGAQQRLPVGTQHWRLGSIGTDPAYFAPQVIGGALPLTADGDMLVRKIQTTPTATIGFIGDSITAGSAIGGAAFAPGVTTVASLSGGGLTVSGSNQGVTSLSSTDWLPGGAYLPGAMTAFASAGVRIVHIMLGTNDQLTTVLNSPATYQANMRSIANTLVAAGYVVVLSFMPIMGTAATGYGAGGSVASCNAQYLLYQQRLIQLADGENIFIGDTLAYSYFAAHPSEVKADGVHPNAANGSADLGNLWADAMRGIVNALHGTTVYQRLVAGAGLAIAPVAGVQTLSATGVGGGSGGSYGSPLIRTPNPNTFISAGASDQPPDFVYLASGDIIGVGNR